MGIISNAPLCAQETTAEGGKGAAAPGLVSSLTSDKQPQSHHVDPRRIRLSRLRRSIVTSARLHEQALQGSRVRYRVAMLTLTYAPYEDYQPRHISELLKRIREYLRARGHRFRYVWVMELTKSGVPHYHVVIWLPRGLTLPKPDKRGWWPYGHTRIEWARKAVAYVAKYASKAESSGYQFPEGARLHGNGGLELADRRERGWWCLPQYIRETCPEPRATGNTKRAKGGGWVTPFGEWINSRFRIKSFNPLVIEERPGWASPVVLPGMDAGAVGV